MAISTSRSIAQSVYVGTVVLGCFLTFCVGAAEQHTEFDVPFGDRSDSDMEHLVVTGEAEDSAEADQRAYQDHRKAMYLYSRGQYDNALPYLISSAKHGFKDSQARLAHLYLHGLGGVRRSDVVGIAWMGVAAHGQTTPVIRRHYDELMSAVPPQHMDSLKRVVEQYVEKYGNLDQNVVCDVATRAGTIIAKNRCYFEYEFAVLSSLEIADMQEYYRDKIIPPDQLSSFSMMDRLSALPAGADPPPAPPTPGAQ